MPRSRIFSGCLLLLCFLSLTTAVFAVSPPVRIKDLSHILEARDNQLMGFGLVVGLKNTGDSQQTGFTRQALTNLLSRMGVAPQDQEFRSRNVAAVMVTANLRPFTRIGQKMDVVVSSLGDAISLRSGTLLLTPMQGVDGDVYAIAQGSVSTAGDTQNLYVPLMERGQNTVAMIPSGALVEKEIPVSMGDRNILTIVLNQPDFTTATRIAYTITRSKMVEAVAKDAGTVLIPVKPDNDLVSLVSKIENLQVVPDSLARVVINERTGTVVVGENVRLAPVAITYGSVTIKIAPMDVFATATSQDVRILEGSTATTMRSTVQYLEGGRKLVQLDAGASLGSLVRALNKIGASPQDMIGILQAIKKAGALTAELEII